MGTILNRIKILVVTLNRRVLAVATITVLAAYPLSALAAEIPKQRLDEILAMSPLEMAETGAWTTAAYDRLLGYIYSIEDSELRSLVLEMYSNPKSSVFSDEVPPDALRTTPATGSPGHQHYPGGLAVHLVEVMEIALGWIATFENVHGIRNTDRDLVLAQLALHDWSKVHMG